MNFDFRAGKTPLLSRQNPVIYAVVLIALVIIGVWLLIWLLLKINRNKKLTPEYIEKEKNRPTQKKDVEKLKSKHNLTKQQASLLLKICKLYEIPNIFYSIKNFTEISPNFNRYFEEQKNSSSDQEINTLFNLKYKLERIFAMSAPLTNTYAIPEKTAVHQIFKDGSKAAYTLYQNRKEFLAIEINEAAYEHKDDSEELQKVAFTFTSETGMSYAFLSRLIRYEKTSDDKYLMIVSHANSLITKTQRHFKRCLINEKTTFSSVKKEKQGKDSKYIPSGSQYSCIMMNISGGGCSLTSTLPIKEGQLICVKLPFGDNEYSVMGKIIHTRKAATPGTYNLHIQFLQMPVKIQNQILAKVNGF